MNKIVIEKHMLVSTSHITKDDDKKLLDHCAHNEKYSYLCADDYEYGFRVHVPFNSLKNKKWTEFLQCMQRDGFSNTFMQLFDLARQHDCCYITLDCDGTEYDSLPTYEW